MAWDSPDGIIGSVEGFTSKGFELDKSLALTCKSAVVPPKLNPDIEVRPHDESELEAALQIQIESGDDHLFKKSWEDFYRKQMDLYKKLMAVDTGLWIGAFVGLSLFPLEHQGTGKKANDHGNKHVA